MSKEKLKENSEQLAKQFGGFMKELFGVFKEWDYKNYFRRFDFLLKRPRVWIVVLFSILFISRNYIAILGGLLMGDFGEVVLYLLRGCILVFLTLNIAMSNTLEKIMRKIEDVRRVATNTEKQRLQSIFASVLHNTNMENRKINLYIIDSMEVNAYSLNHSVVLNRGLLDTMNDDEIEAVIAHELAHIYNCDTKITILINTLLFFTITPIYLIWFAVLVVEKMLDGIIALSSLAGLVRMVLDKIISLINNVVLVITSGVTRTEEFKADCFASKHGYNAQLTQALYKLYSMQMSDKKDLRQQIKASHPKLAYRIEQLEQEVSIP